MFAYIKFLEGPSLQKKERVPVSKIRHVFNDYQNFDKKKKYFVQDKDGIYYKAMIIFFYVSIEAIEKRTKKRIVMPPANDLETVSETDSFEENKGSLLLKSKSTIQQPLKLKQEERFKKYATILNIKCENLQKAIDQPVTNNKIVSEREFESSKILESALNNAKVDISDNEQNVRTQEDTSKIKENQASTSNRKAHKKKKVGTVALQTQNGQNNAKLNISKSNKGYIKENNAGVVEASQTGESKTLHIISNLKVVSEAEFSKKLNILQAELDQMKNSHQSTKKDYEKLQNKYSNIKTELKNATEKYSKFRDLNIQLQEKILEAKKEEEAINSKKSDAKGVLNTSNFINVGYYRQSSGMIHLGRDQWLSHVTCSDIKLKSDSACQFVGHMLTAVFGINTLTKSTVTGKGCNRNINKNAGKNVDDAFEKLDLVKLEAIKDYYCYWLQTEWALNPEEEEYKVEKSKFREYCAKKISYLKRPPRSNKTGDDMFCTGSA